MHRREFLKTTSAAALATATAASGAGAADANAAIPTATLAAPAVHHGTRTLRFYAPLLASDAWAGDHAYRLSQRLVAAFDGRWRIDVVAQVETHARLGEGKVAGALEAFGTGQADLAFGDDASINDLLPELSYITGLPCGLGMDAAAVDAWLRAGGGQELWDEALADFGVKGLLAGSTGRDITLWSRTPVTSLADLEGKTTALLGLGHKVAIGLGAEARRSDSENLLQDLAPDEIDVAETPDSSLAMRRRLAAIAPHGYVSPFAIDGANLTLSIHRAIYDGLSNGERVVLEGVCAEAFAMARAEHAASRAMAAMAATMTAGASAPLLGVPRLPDEITHAARTVAASVVAETTGQTLSGRRMAASFMAFRRATPADTADRFA